jgi:Sec-independent protein translocase protein TatA
MEGSFFQEAKKRMVNMMNTNQQPSDEDRESTMHAIQAAYAQATPEEEQELQKLEQQMRQNQLL